MGYPPIRSLALKMFLPVCIQISSMSQLRLSLCLGNVCMCRILVQTG